MGMSTEDLERMAKLAALLQLGFAEFAALYARLQAQEGENSDEMNTNAAERNKEARRIIESL